VLEIFIAAQNDFMLSCPLQKQASTLLPQFSNW